MTTIYNLILNANDVEIPKEILITIQENFPLPLAEINGGYGINIDDETISIAMISNAMTFYKNRIIFINTVK